MGDNDDGSGGGGSGGDNGADDGDNGGDRGFAADEMPGREQCVRRPGESAEGDSALVCRSLPLVCRSLPLVCCSL